MLFCTITKGDTLANISKILYVSISEDVKQDGTRQVDSLGTVRSNRFIAISYREEIIESKRAPICQVFRCIDRFEFLRFVFVLELNKEIICLFLACQREET